MKSSKSKLQIIMNEYKDTALTSNSTKNSKYFDQVKESEVQNYLKAYKNSENNLIKNDLYDDTKYYSMKNLRSKRNSENYNSKFSSNQFQFDSNKLTKDSKIKLSDIDDSNSNQSKNINIKEKLNDRFKNIQLDEKFTDSMKQSNYSLKKCVLKNTILKSSDYKQSSINFNNYNCVNLLITDKSKRIKDNINLEINTFNNKSNKRDNSININRKCEDVFDDYINKEKSTSSMGINVKYELNKVKKIVNNIEMENNNKVNSNINIAYEIPKNKEFITDYYMNKNESTNYNKKNTKNAYNFEVKNKVSFNDSFYNDSNKLNRENNENNSLKNSYFKNGLNDHQISSSNNLPKSFKNENFKNRTFKSTNFDYKNDFNTLDSIVKGKNDLQDLQFSELKDDISKYNNNRMNFQISNIK